ncbi:hypothetical protein [Tenacibaculum sp.]|uniref:hypothetical protein n=1 Tax=Tenacibaculum sp. TaxID=1906242 RepID=UPI003D0EA128
MKTLKITLLISMLTLLTTSCTDLTEDIVPNNTIVQTELISGTDTTDSGTGGTTDFETGDGDGDGNDGTKGN